MRVFMLKEEQRALSSHWDSWADLEEALQTLMDQTGHIRRYTPVIPTLGALRQKTDMSSR